MLLTRTVLAAMLALVQSGTWTPAKLSDGKVPEDPLAAREGDYALFEVRVSPAGTVTQVIELEGRPPLAERIAEIVAAWRFEPATSAGEPIATTVLVGAVARTPTALRAIPPLPKSPDANEASSEVPYPKRIAVPSFPPQARFGGVALLEAEIDAAGKVVSTDVVQTSHAYDELSEDALREWEFHAGAFGGAPVTTRAYFVFSFRAPLTAR
jgi:hypothetical protein